MPNPRNHHRVIAGPVAGLYVLGGQSASFTLISTLELYDPLTQTWTFLSNMPTMRADSGAAFGPDGKLYTVGGSTGLSPDFRSNALEVYDPVTNSWETRASMPTPRGYLQAVFAPNGKLYAIGGYGTTYLNTVEEYDPATNSWTPRASMPTARCCGAALVAPNGKIYYIGGEAANVSGPTSAVEEYDPATDSWTPRASLSTQRDLPAGVVVGGRLFAIAGRDATAAYLSSVESYDPDSNIWSPHSGLSVARWGVHGAVASNGKIYVMGGSDDAFVYGIIEEGTVAG